MGASKKLSVEDVRLIRQLIAARKQLEEDVKALDNRRIAEKFDVHVTTIREIASYRTYIGREYDI